MIYSLLKRIFLFSVITFFMFGCLTPLKEVMHGWMGFHIEDVTAVWGVPQNKMERDDGGSTYTWTTFHGNLHCRRSFTTNSSGKIVDWSYDNCPHRVKTN